MNVLFLYSSFAWSASTDELNQWMNSVVLLTNGPAFCSGVLISKDQVATAYHCAVSSNKTAVYWENEDQAQARLLYANPYSDLAVLQLTEPVDAPVRPIASEQTVRGQPVWTMGHPYAPYATRRKMEGTLRWSVSSGVISQVGETFLQTDAALNPGNSGGPTFDEEGNIVGIASRKLNGENLSFLAPATDLQQLLEEQVAPKWWGGYWSLGLQYRLSFDINDPIVYGIFAQTTHREHVELQLGLMQDSFWSKQGSRAQSLELSVGTRQGVSSAETYGAVSAGAMLQTSHLDYANSEFSFAPYLAFYFSGTNIRYYWNMKTETLGLTLQVHYPGMLGIF